MHSHANSMACKAGDRLEVEVIWSKRAEGVALRAETWKNKKVRR